MSGTLSRELTARIVKDLARASRSVPAIASRYRVPESTVVALRDFYGPGIPQLIDAAEELRRVSKPVEGAPPVGPLAVSGTAEDVAPQPEPEPEPEDEEPEVKPRRGDGLTSAERVDCRSWCASTGREVGSFGMIARDVVDAWDAAGRPLLAVVDAEPVEESDDDGVVDVPIVEDAGGVSWPAYIAMETPEASRILAAAKVALTDVADILPWAVEHCPDAVWDWVGKSAELTDTVAVERIEQDRVQAAAQVLYELALQGLLQPTPDALHRAAQLALAAAEAA